HTPCAPRHTLLAQPPLPCSPRTRAPPRSTLFPYTTLFRSLGARHLSHLLPIRRRAALFDPRFLFQEHGGGGRLGDERERPVLEEDRKSTRLNSSHVSISYAVFCLKKKNVALGMHVLRYCLA